MITKVAYKVEPAHPFVREHEGRMYNVKVVTSVDGGRSFWYCGIGRFVRNLTEAFAYVNEYETERS